MNNKKSKSREMERQYKVIIADDGKEIVLKQVLDFLYLFRTVYTASLSSYEYILKSPVADLKSTNDLYLSMLNAHVIKLKSQLYEESLEEINSHFYESESEKELVVKNISMNSPLVILLGGSFFFLTLAVILSGGKIKLSHEGVEAELPPIAVGISTLLNVFSSKKAGYYLNNKVIYLNEEEYKELCIENNDNKGKGGFQNFIIKLKEKVRKIGNNNYELTLENEDIERILKYGSKPKSGGWQKRIYKIFGRHLNFSKKL